MQSQQHKRTKSMSNVHTDSYMLPAPPTTRSHPCALDHNASEWRQNGTLGIKRSHAGVHLANLGSKTRSKSPRHTENGSSQRTSTTSCALAMRSLDHNLAPWPRSTAVWTPSWKMMKMTNLGHPLQGYKLQPNGYETWGGEWRGYPEN